MKTFTDSLDAGKKGGGAWNEQQQNFGGIGTTSQFFDANRKTQYTNNSVMKSRNHFMPSSRTLQEQNQTIYGGNFMNRPVTH